jgi:hypothetical protein
VSPKLDEVDHVRWVTLDELAELDTRSEVDVQAREALNEVRIEIFARG